jgi:tyrosinase
MWQVINPNPYVVSGVTTQSNWQWNSGEMKNQYSPLKPFTKNVGGSYYTSADVRNTRTFNYYYPETYNGATASSVRSAVNSLYGPSSTSRFRRDLASRGTYEGRPVQHGDHEYHLNLNCHKFALDGSYSILAFLGNVSTDVASWYEAPNLAGMHGVLAMKGMNNGTAVEIEASIPLTTTLQGKVATGELESLAPYHVSSYLKTHLTWRVVKGGYVVPADEVPGLHIQLATCPVEPPKAADEFPTWVGTPYVLANVTAGKPAGGAYTPPASPTYGNPGYNPTYTETAKPYYPTSTNNPFPYNPSNPADEPGYCVSHQTIEYVDENGAFLYSEKSY